MEENKKEKKSWINEHFTQIMTAAFAMITAITVGWFTATQYSRDRITDIKIEQMRLFNEEKINTNNRHVAVIYSELYDLMHKLDVDRVFIIQPHPEIKYIYLSVFLEVDKKGISMVKDMFQNIPISEMPKFSKVLATTNWLYFTDINSEVGDARTQSLMRTMGSTNIAIRQLTNTSGEWIGSLVAENTQGRDLNGDAAMNVMKNTANTIQYILPPIN